MNLNKIREVLSSGMPEENIRMAIIQIIADDKEAISDVLKILSFEREIKDKIISELNLNLGRADLCIENSSWFDGNKKGTGKEFVRGEISAVYEEFNQYIRNPFRKNKDEVK